LLLIGCGGGCGDGATAFTLKIDANPNAGGTVSPSGDIKYSAGTKAEVTATAADGYRFIGWSGASTDKAKSITVAMSSDQALTANFEKAQVITDSRDGKKYRIVKIGKLTWMAQNLNFGTVNRWCYDNNTSNCAKYGRLYNWNAAMNACPSGWRLPTLEDWNELVEAAGGNVAGTKLKASSPDWNGTDEFGFSALPGGYRNTYGSFGGVGSYGGWWSAAEDDGGNAWLRDMSSNYDGVIQRSYGKNHGFSVVCVQG
jgi:uncharacterized protein (TIGR02145 family)/uncharacterized repeat protein (TIGR02543 family)